MQLKVTKFLILLIVLQLVQITTSLHVNQNSSIHYNATFEAQVLTNQQYSFENAVNVLVKHLHNISSQLNSTTNTSLQVSILEQSITSEHQKIFQMQQALIPPFNLSKTSCQQLTIPQKSALLQQVSAAESQLGSMKLLMAGMAPNTMISQIASDISQQQTTISNLKKVIYSKCTNTKVYSLAAFQSNLYATNWVLGKQTITDLVNQYYQRSQLYKSVNNCPITSPFYDGVNCTQCKGISPIFNMQTGIC